MLKVKYSVVYKASISDSQWQGCKQNRCLIEVLLFPADISQFHYHHLSFIKKLTNAMHNTIEKKGEIEIC